MGEIVPDYRYEDVIIQALPAEYEYVKNKSYGDSDFDMESIRRTINNIFIGNLHAPTATARSPLPVEARP